MSEQGAKRGKILHSEIPVIVFSRNLPGLKIRFMADRDEGEVRWEVGYLDSEGSVYRTEERRFGLAELLNIESLIADLYKAVGLLTPIRRLDLITLDPPASCSFSTGDLDG